jgi:hypothetical protein
VREEVGAYYTVMADGVLMMRHLSNLRAWEGCDLRTEWTDDMKAEERPALRPAEQVLAVAYFA